MDLRSDLRDAWRLARHEPGFAAIAILTVALGVGAATILFSLVNGVLLRPLPWRDADRLVRVSETRKGATRNFPGALTNGTFLAWAEKPATIEGLAAWTTDKVTLTSSAGAPERIDVVGVTPSLFPMLRADAIAGAVFKAGDEQEGHPPVVVLSHALWQQRFASDPHIVGTLVRLDGEATTVVGVMPAGFEFPNAEARAWTPFLMRSVAGKEPGSTNIQLFQAMAKLRPGVTAAQAAAEGNARAAKAPALNMVGMAVFGTKSPAELQVVPALEAMTSEVRQPLLLFLAAVGLLVLTATANIASLQLVRAAARRRDTAIRTALGAGAGRLARPMIVESVALGVLGGAAGLALAAALHRVLPAVMPPRFPRLDAVHIDPTVALFAIGAVARERGRVWRHSVVPGEPRRPRVGPERGRPGARGWRSADGHVARASSDHRRSGRDRVSAPHWRPVARAEFRAPAAGRSRLRPGQRAHRPDHAAGHDL